jgi:Na+-translocating ferredoxin:NAD+ oxidoreductase RnfG subunit
MASDRTVSAVRSHKSVPLIILALALLVLSAAWERVWHGVAENRRRVALESRVNSMLDGTAGLEPMTLRVADRTVRPSRSTSVNHVYRAIDRQGETLGYVIVFRGPGYQNEIEGILAVDSAVTRILGLTIAESWESPEADLFREPSDFLDQFRTAEVRSPLRLMSPAEEGIHAITGASISSQIIVRFVNESLSALRSQLQQPESTE